MIIYDKTVESAVPAVGPVATGGNCGLLRETAPQADNPKDVILIAS